MKELSRVYRVRRIRLGFDMLSTPFRGVTYFGVRKLAYALVRHGLRPHLSPLARGTTGGVVQINEEDPLPQETRRPPWKGGQM